METVYHNTATRPRTNYFTSNIIHRRETLTTRDSWSSAHIITSHLPYPSTSCQSDTLCSLLLLSPEYCSTILPNAKLCFSVNTSIRRLLNWENLLLRGPRMISGTSSSRSFRLRLVAPSRAFYPPSTNFKKYASLHPPAKNTSLPLFTDSIESIHVLIKLGPCEKTCPEL